MTELHIDTVYCTCAKGMRQADICKCFVDGGPVSAGVPGGQPDGPNREAMLAYLQRICAFHERPLRPTEDTPHPPTCARAWEGCGIYYGGPYLPGEKCWCGYRKDGTK
jgi:hypothetical protein